MFIVTNQNMTYVNNILKLTRGICEQKPYWTPEMIFGQLAKKIVAFFDVTMGEDCKLMCVKLLITMINLTNEKEKPYEPLGATSSERGSSRGSRRATSTRANSLSLCTRSSF